MIDEISLFRHGVSNGATQWKEMLRTDHLLAPSTDRPWDDLQGDFSFVQDVVARPLNDEDSCSLRLPEAVIDGS